MPARLVLFLAALAAAGCADGRSTEALLDAARDAETAGHYQEAIALTRDAAHRGHIGAALTLSARGSDKRTLGDWLFDPRPTHTEARYWEARVCREAARQIAAGDPEGHLTLSSMAMINGQFLDARPDSLALARRHLDAAAALGSRDAVFGRAMLVMQTDSLLAAEPYFRESLRAGDVRAAGMLAIIVQERGLLEQGQHPRDVPGDLSQIDIVGAIRFLQDAGFPETRADAAERIRELRAEARAGSTDADSILHALDRPQPAASS